MKKLLLGLGTLAAVVAPITTIVACGTTSDPGTEGPSMPDNGNQNPGTDQASVDYEQTRVNAFTSTGVTKQNELVATSTPFTSEIGLKYGLSVELHTDIFSYEYTSTVTGITIMVTKISDESKPTVVPTEISVAPFVVISEEILNSITKEEISLVIAKVVVADNNVLPEDLISLPELVQVVSSVDGKTSVAAKLVWTRNNDVGSIEWIATIDNRTNTDVLSATILGFKTKAVADQEKAEANANSITQDQVSKLIFVTPDKTKSPSEVTGLPNMVNVELITDTTVTIVVNLAWTSNDANGSLTWNASVENRTSGALTRTITGYKVLTQDLISINEEQKFANSLLSMGSTAESSDRVQAAKTSLDAAAIAKYGIKNVDGTPYTFKSDFTYEYTATETSVKIYVSKGSEISTIEPIEILISRNSFEGTFTTLEKKKEFLAVTNNVVDSAFEYESFLTSISLPEVRTIGYDAFSRAPLVYIYLPALTSCGSTALANTRTLASTRVVLQKIFDTDEQKNKIFGKVQWLHDWTKINFIWKISLDIEQTNINSLLSMGSTANVLDRVQLDKTSLDSDSIAKYGIKNVDGTPYAFNSEFTYKYTATKTSIKIYVSKVSETLTIEPIEILISRNSFEGTFTTLEKKKEFLAVTNNVVDSAFESEIELTSLSLPDVTTIGDSAFKQARITSLFLPAVKSIGSSTFQLSSLMSLSLPEVTSISNSSFKECYTLASIDLPKIESIGDNAFFSSPLTSLSLPKVVTIGDGAFKASKITSLSLPKVESIGVSAFSDSLITSLYLPEATHIKSYAFINSPLASISLSKFSAQSTVDAGKNIFSNIINASTTIVTFKELPIDFMKDHIFGSGNWNNIAFKAS